MTTRVRPRRLGDHHPARVVLRERRPQQCAGSRPDTRSHPSENRSVGSASIHSACSFSRSGKYQSSASRNASQSPLAARAPALRAADDAAVDLPDDRDGVAEAARRRRPYRRRNRRRRR